MGSIEGPYCTWSHETCFCSNATNHKVVRLLAKLNQMDQSVCNHNQASVNNVSLLKGIFFRLHLQIFILYLSLTLLQNILFCKGSVGFLFCFLFFIFY